MNCAVEFIISPVIVLNRAFFHFWQGANFGKRILAMNYNLSNLML